jgi:hypothetical protein
MTGKSRYIPEKGVRREGERGFYKKATAHANAITGISNISAAKKT